MKQTKSCPRIYQIQHVSDGSLHNNFVNYDETVTTKINIDETNQIEAAVEGSDVANGRADFPVFRCRYISDLTITSLIVMKR